MVWEAVASFDTTTFHKLQGVEDFCEFARFSKSPKAPTPKYSMHIHLMRNAHMTKSQQ